jgi:hypothetical protein
MRYLNQRGLHDPALIQELQIGYAPGRSLRRHLTTRGYSFDLLRRSACSTRRARMPSTRASSSHCAKTNPSSTSTAVVLAPPLPIAFSQAPRADCMPGRKVQQCSEGILVEVEGRFDYAVLWQAGSPVTWGAVKGAPEWAGPLG